MAGVALRRLMTEYKRKFDYFHEQRNLIVFIFSQN